MLDILIKHAKVIDGTGALAVCASVGICGDKIVYPVTEEDAKEVIDGTGRIVCPGFIDAHSHGDLILGTTSAHLFKTNQGVTTEVTGQCGLSIAPTNPEFLDLTQHLLSLGTPLFPDDMVHWNTFSRYLDYADRQPKTANAMMYVGHSTLRIAVMGFANRVATDEELEQMKSILRDAMEHGAAGFSTGLIYTPSCYADEREVLELAKVIQPYDGIYASHMRNESYDMIKSVEETIDVGRKAGVRVCISHHKTLGKANWGLQKETLHLICQAREEGILVVCDQYPYTCNMTHLNACIPPWHFDQGFDTMTEQLKNPSFRETLKREMEDPVTPYDNYYLNAGGWKGVFVSSAAKTPAAEGKFISDYANEIGKDPWDTFFDLMIENKCSSGGVYSSMCEEDVCEIASAPFCIVGSDGLTRSWEEKGHPRACGTFPHAINYFVKEKNIFTIEQMIRKMTGLTADSLAIKNKGYIRHGYDADLVLFDYDRLQDTATYTNSNSLTKGIDYVIVNGKVVYKDMELTGVYAGRMIRHNA